MTKKNKKITLANTQPKKSTPIGFHIEIDKIMGGLSVCVNGVSSVFDFCDEYAVLKLGRLKLKVCGHGLLISVYENKVAEISGNVERVEFL